MKKQRDNFIELVQCLIWLIQQRKILKNIGCHPDIISLIKPEHLRKKDIDNTKYFGIKRPRQRRNKKIKSKEENKNKNKQGRKLKFGNEKGKHNKYSPDNIIKKIKRIFFTNAIEYVNKLLLKYKQTFKCSDKLKKLNYGLYVNKSKKQNDSDELIMEKNTIKKQVGNNDTSKENKSNWNDSIVEYGYENNHEYFNKFKDNDSYNDYVINMESIIGVKDIDIDKENNYLLEKIIFEK